MSQTPRTPDELLAQHGKAVYGYLVNRTRSRTDADDLYQDFALRVVRSWSQFRHGDGRAWAFRIARNRLLTFLGRRRSESVPDVAIAMADSLVAGEEATEHEQLLGRLAGCMSRLSDAQRQVVTGRAAGLECNDLATQMQLPLQAIYDHAENGLARLKRCLGVPVGGANG